MMFLMLSFLEIRRTKEAQRCFPTLADLPVNNTLFASARSSGHRQSCRSLSLCCNCNPTDFLLRRQPSPDRPFRFLSYSKAKKSARGGKDILKALTILQCVKSPDPENPGGQAENRGERIEFLNRGVPVGTLNPRIGALRFQADIIPCSYVEHPRTATSPREITHDDATTTINSPPIVKCNGGDRRWHFDRRRAWAGCQARPYAIQIPFNGSLLVPPPAGRSVY